MELFEEKAKWLPMEVKDKATGDRIVIKDYKFNPELHEQLTAVKEVKETPKVEGSRFEELKAKGWAKLTGEERKEYKALK